MNKEYEKLKQCKYFYNAFKDKGIIVNSGFNCKHPRQKEIYYEQDEKIGCCDLWSCPLTKNQ